MEITNVNSLLLFILLFIPGFVSIKVYDLLISNESRDFSKSFIEALSYGAINAAILSWWIWPLITNNFINDHPIKITLSAVMILLVFPVIWPILSVQLLKLLRTKKLIVHPVKRPWDWFFFNQIEPLWVIVNLKDGTKIGGVFANKSFASSYPAGEQLYIESIWELDEVGKFIKAIVDSKGTLIMGKEISFIEFFKMEE